jgi:phosphocarrier protein HPr
VTETDLVIRNVQGLHVRAAGLFVRVAGKYKSEIFVSRDDREVNGKSILGVIDLAAEAGSTIRVRAVGPDEEAAVAALRELVDGKFGEEP